MRRKGVQGRIIMAMVTGSQAYRCRQSNSRIHNFFRSTRQFSATSIVVLFLLLFIFTLFLVRRRNK